MERAVEKLLSAGLAELMQDLMVDIARNRCPLTEAQILEVAESDMERAQLLSGLKMLHESFQLQREEIDESRRQAEQASRAKSELMANVSHEVFTPMNGIMGGLLTFDGVSLSPEGKQSLEAVRTSAEALLDVLQALLEFSEIEGARGQELAVAREVFDLRRWVEDLCTTVEQQARRKGLCFRLALDAKLSQQYVGDARRVRQALRHLLDNALKFTSEGCTSLTVSRSDRGAVFVVEDTGAGMTPEQLQYIFEPFRQADGTLTRSHGGTGLGTTIARRIIERLGGQLLVESRVGQGTRMTFELPLAEKPSDSIRTVLPQQVLLVEDNPINQGIVKFLLRKLGHEVTVAHNGEEALRAIEQRSFAAVIMDCQMPVMDGYEATRRIRERESGTGERLPVIALTAHVIPGARERCLEAGMDDYLTKPVHVDQLQGALERAFTRKG